MKRPLSAILALMLALSLTAPALAAGTPDWDGPLGPSAGPQLCKTGKDYVLYYTLTGGVYRSSNGIDWTELDRQWAEDAAPYGSGLNGLAHKEFQFLWTGTEYMMRQSLLDDPRDTHQNYGDSPRNDWVTFLDADFRIIGAKAFNGPVTAISYTGGTYHATVDGVDHAFSRADWDPGQEGGAYYSGTAWYGQEGWEAPMEISRYIIREQPGNDGPFALAVSTDGRSWLPLETKLTPDMMRLSETGGGAVVYYSPYTGELYYYDYTGGRFAGACTAGWVEADLGFDPAEGLGSAWVDYTFCWTGDGYIMCLSASGRGMMGVGADETSPYNSKVIFLDRTFRKTEEHDLGAPVEDVACVDGVCWAKAGGKVYQSADRATWTATDLTALPTARTAPGRQVKDLADGDLTDGKLVYRASGGKLLVSWDGVYFTTLCPWTSADLEICAGQGGAVLTGLDGNGNETDERRVVDYGETVGAIEACYGQAPTYAALEGTYIRSVDRPFYQRSGCTMAPLRQLAEAFGYTFAYDAAARTAVCTKDGASIQVTVGRTASQVTGREGVPMAVPPELTAGVLYVPLRFWVDASGWRDRWDPETSTIWIERQ